MFRREVTTSLIRILDSQDKLTVVLSRKDPIEQRHIRSTNMGIARRGWGDAGSNLHKRRLKPHVFGIFWNQRIRNPGHFLHNSDNLAGITKFIVVPNIKDNPIIFHDHRFAIDDASMTITNQI